MRFSKHPHTLEITKVILDLDMEKLEKALAKEDIDESFNLFEYLLLDYQQYASVYGGEDLIEYTKKILQYRYLVDNLGGAI